MIADAVEKERREKQAATQAKGEPIGTLMSQQSQPDELKTAHKAAEMFGTNRTYINQSHSSGIVTSLVKVIADAVDKARRDKISKARKAEAGQLIVPSQPSDKTAHKAAEMFGTNQHEQVSKLDT